MSHRATMVMRARGTDTDYDLVILGGGCAGLSLAERLGASGSAKLRVGVIEGRNHYTNDRTWCFFGPRHHRFSHLVRKSWGAWSFSDQAQEQVHDGEDRVFYQCVQAADFYAHALASIDNNSNITLLKGTTVQSLEKAQGRWNVHTTGGSLRTRWVIDTRNNAIADDNPGRYAQFFQGVEIRTSTDSFDASTAGLMQNMACDEHGFRFTYLLPFSSRHALVEETRFGFAAARGLLKMGLDSALGPMTRGQPYECLREERGMIPMAVGSDNSQVDAGMWRAGTAGGAVRPSTGYAFTRIQSWAALCADGLQKGKPPHGHPPDPSWRRAADRLFLRVLQTRPELAPKLFMAMAVRVPPASFVRFLGDQGRPRDFLRVAASLPKRPFLSEWLHPARER